MSQLDESSLEPFTTAQSYLSSSSPRTPVNSRIISLPNVSDHQRNLLVQHFIESSSPASSAMIYAKDEAVPFSDGASSMASTAVLPSDTMEQIQAEARRNHAREQIPEISTLLKNLSLSIPETRVAVHVDQSDGERVIKSSGIIHTEQPAKGVDILCAAQSPADVDYTMEIQFKTPRVHSKLTNIKYQIVYDPGSDDCVLIHQAKKILYLVNLEYPYTYGLIQPSLRYNIGPGLWGIADVQSDDVLYDCIVKFLLRGRRHTVSITPRSEARNSKRLRERQALDANSATDIAISSLGFRRDLRSSAKKASKNPLLDLQDGDLANIEAPLPTMAFRQEAPTYQLKVSKKLSPKGAASVFACRHSLILGNLAVKVVANENEPLNELGLAHCSKLWRRETGFLQKLKHRNIVSLKAFDSRLLVLYLEFLPQSLARGRDSPFSLSDACKIVNNISSALAYLEQEGIVHNDIKPSNIAYSASRGAVLLDFGMASFSNELSRGGTPWYIPPELSFSSKRCSAGDIWAFGVTMLYVLKIIQYPESIAKSWNINEIRKKSGAAKKQMKDWLDFIYSARDGLDTTSPIQYTTFLMLDEKRNSRITAAGIQNTLDYLQ